MTIQQSVNISRARRSDDHLTRIYVLCNKVHAILRIRCVDVYCAMRCDVYCVLKLFDNVQCNRSVTSTVTKRLDRMKIERLAKFILQ